KKKQQIQDTVGLTDIKLQPASPPHVFDVETHHVVQLTDTSLAALCDSLGGGVHFCQKEGDKIISELAEIPLPESSIPTSDEPDLFKTGFVDYADLDREDFKTFNYGHIYGVKRAPDSHYQLIFVAVFLNLDDFNAQEHTQLQHMFHWFTLAHHVEISGHWKCLPEWGFDSWVW
ncbi:hypothetical protein FRC11_007329, partial [Ceratobasidium sp. 423]